MDTMEALGTAKQVQALSDRNAIPAARRTVGMTCYVVQSNLVYRLVGGIDNTNWIQDTFQLSQSLSNVVNQASNLYVGTFVGTATNMYLSNPTFNNLTGNVIHASQSIDSANTIQAQVFIGNLQGDATTADNLSSIGFPLTNIASPMIISNPASGKLNYSYNASALTNVQTAIASANNYGYGFQVQSTNQSVDPALTWSNANGFTKSITLQAGTSNLVSTAVITAPALWGSGSNLTQLDIRDATYFPAPANGWFPVWSNGAPVWSANGMGLTGGFSGSFTGMFTGGFQITSNSSPSAPLADIIAAHFIGAHIGDGSGLTNVSSATSSQSATNLFTIYADIFHNPTLKWIANNSGTATAFLDANTNLEISAEIIAPFFSGDGSLLINLPGGQITGTVAPSHMGTNAIVVAGTNITVQTNFSGSVLTYTVNGSAGATGWSLTGNAGTTGANFLGTLDGQPLTFKVNSTIYGAIDSLGDINFGSGHSVGSPTTTAPNVISGGYQSSIINGTPGGNTISGGKVNLIFASGGYDTISGGLNNTMNGTVLGGSISGGQGNTISSVANYATIAGGYSNVISGSNSWAGGSQVNITNNGAFSWADAQNAKYFSPTDNTFSVRAQNGVVFNVGSTATKVATDGTFSGNGSELTNLSLASLTNPAAPANGWTVVWSNGVPVWSLNGGSLTNVGAASYWLTTGNSGIGSSAFVGTTDTNALKLEVNSTLVGYLDKNGSIQFGQSHNVSGVNNAVSGGQSNYISGTAANVIAGGTNNSIGGLTVASAISGGAWNTITNSASQIRGSVIAGGISNTVSGDFSLAAGFNATVTNKGAFAWADSQTANFATTNDNSFNVRASGGVQFKTSGATVSSDGLWTGDGSGLTNLNYFYTTNAIPGLVLSFKKSYFTNLTSDITLGSFANVSASGFESLVLMVTVPAGSDHKVTMPANVIGPPNSGVPPVFWCTNGQLTQIVVNHYAQQLTNAFKIDTAP